MNMSLLSRTTSRTAAATRMKSEVLSSTTAASFVAVVAFVAGVVISPWLLSSLPSSFWLLWKNKNSNNNKEKREEKKKDKKAKKKKKTTTTTTEADAAESHLWRIVANSFTLTVICACDELDMYDLLSYADDGITPHELSNQTGWSHRWITELLAQSTAAGLCQYDSSTERFSLHPSYKPYLLGPERSPKSLIGLFPFVRALVGGRKDAIVNAVKTGIGVDYDFGNGNDNDGGDYDVTMAIDRKNRNFFKYHLVDEILSKVKVKRKRRRRGGGEEGFVETSLLKMLKEEAVNVADIGCGCGSSTIVMAKEFPHANIFAYESSPKSLQVLKERIHAENIQNVTVCDVTKRTIGDGPDLMNDPNSKFDFVYAHDVVHDMTQPKAFIRDVYHRLSDNGGVWVIVDVDCQSSLSANLKNLPNADTLYGFSCTLCLQSATSQAGGEGLGTCGFPEELARQWMTTNEGAGFTRFETMKIKSLPRNSCFIVGK